MLSSSQKSSNPFSQLVSRLVFEFPTARIERLGSSKELEARFDLTVIFSVFVGVGFYVGVYPLKTRGVRFCVGITPNIEGQHSTIRRLEKFPKLAAPQKART